MKALHENVRLFLCLKENELVRTTHDDIVMPIMDGYELVKNMQITLTHDPTMIRNISGIKKSPRFHSKALIHLPPPRTGSNRRPND